MACSNPSKDGRKDINVLLLGQQGVPAIGKSTFVNILVNYLIFDTFDEADKCEPILPVPCKIVPETIFKTREDYCEMNATHTTKTYVLPIDEKNINLRFIITPEFTISNDDDYICEHILAYLRLLKEIHAICLFVPVSSLKSQEPLPERSVHKILSHLGHSIADNFIFLYEGDSSGVNKSRPLVNKFVDNLKNSHPTIEILSKPNCSFYVNIEPFFNLRHYIKDMFTYRIGLKKWLQEAWLKSSLECKRLLSVVTESFKPLKIKGNFSLNEARRLIVQMSLPLVDVALTIHEFISVLDNYREHQKETMLNEELTLEELKETLYIPVVRLQTTKLNHPITTCVSSICAEIYKVWGVDKWRYRTICHEPCFSGNLSNVFIGDPGAVNCIVMSSEDNKDYKSCSNCGCKSDNHMHVYYKAHLAEDRINYNFTENPITDKVTVLAAIKQLIITCKERRKKLEAQLAKVFIAMILLSEFFENNNIATTILFSCQQYINYQWMREESVEVDSINQNAVENLSTFTRKLKLVETNLHGKKIFRPVGNPEDCINYIRTIYEIPNYGRTIQELCEMQEELLNFEYEKNCFYINPKKLQGAERLQFYLPPSASSSNESENNSKEEDSASSSTSDSLSVPSQQGASSQQGTSLQDPTTSQESSSNQGPDTHYERLSLDSSTHSESELPEPRQGSSTQGSSASHSDFEYILPDTSLEMMRTVIKYRLPSQNESPTASDNQSNDAKMITKITSELKSVFRGRGCFEIKDSSNQQKVFVPSLEPSCKSSFPSQTAAPPQKFTKLRSANLPHTITSQPSVAQPQGSGPQADDPSPKVITSQPRLKNWAPNFSLAESFASLQDSNSISSHVCGQPGSSSEQCPWSSSGACYNDTPQSSYSQPIEEPDFAQPELSASVASQDHDDVLPPLVKPDFSDRSPPSDVSRPSLRPDQDFFRQEQEQGSSSQDDGSNSLRGRPGFGSNQRTRPNRGQGRDVGRRGSRRFKN